MKLSTCSTCEGLAPIHLERCPHCDAPRHRSRRPHRALQAVGGGALAMTLMACYGAPPGSYPVVAPASTGDCSTMSEDVDGDGFCAEDCDEVNAAIHPGADDPPGDGYDQNCDGIDGTQGIDGGPGAPTGYAEPPDPGATLAEDPEPETRSVIVESAR